MQFTKNARAAVILTVVGVVSPGGGAPALHNLAGHEGGGQRDGVETGMMVGNYWKKADADDCIFGCALSFGFFLQLRRLAAFSLLVVLVF